MHSERQVPCNVEAEQAVIGAVLIDNDVMADLSARLRPADFCRAQHSLIFESMQRLHERRQPIDFITVIEELARLRHDLAGDRDRREEFASWVDTGADYLADMAERVPTAANAAFYAAQVRNRSELRAIMFACDDIADDAQNFAGDLSDFKASAEEKLLAVTRRESGQAGATPAAHAIVEWHTGVEAERAAVGVNEMHFPQQELAALHGRLRSMHVLAGRPSDGKSSLANETSARLSLAGHRVLHVSTQFSRAQVVSVMIAQLAKVNHGRLEEDRLPDHEMQRAIDAAHALAGTPLRIESASARWEQVEKEAHRMLGRDELDLIVVDYFNQCVGSAEYKEMARTSKRMQAFVRESGCPLLLLAQINRAGAKGGTRPTQNDLKGCGDLEEDATSVLLIHHTGESDQTGNKLVEIIQAKNTNRGRHESVLLRWDGWRRLFSDREIETPLPLPQLPPAYNSNLTHEPRNADWNDEGPTL